MRMSRIYGPDLWHYSTGILRKKGKIYVGSHGALRQQLISFFHDTPFGGHSGQLGTLKMLSQLFYCPKMSLWLMIMCVVVMYAT